MWCSLNVMWLHFHLKRMLITRLKDLVNIHWFKCFWKTSFSVKSQIFRSQSIIIRLVTVGHVNLFNTKISHQLFGYKIFFLTNCFFFETKLKIIYICPSKILEILEWVEISPHKILLNLLYLVTQHHTKFNTKIHILDFTVEQTLKSLRYYALCVIKKVWTEK